MDIKTAADLDKRIAELEERQIIQKQLLEDQFENTVDHFKPGNLLKSAVHKITHPDNAGQVVMSAVGGLGLGVLTKKLLIGKSRGIVGMLASNALKMGVTGAVAKNSDKFKAWGSAIYKNLFQKDGKLSKKSES